MLTCRPVPQARPRVETLGYDWEKMGRREAPVLVSGLKSATWGHPCPCGWMLSKKERFMTRCIEAPPRGGTSVPFFVRAPMGALRCFPIIAQDFSPGRLVCRLRKKDVVFF